MKLFQILLLLILFQSVSSASYYMGTRDFCIEDFYAKGGNFYFLKSSNSTWYYTTSHNNLIEIVPSFTYDINTNICTPPDFFVLGMDIKDFNFLLGLIGVLIGGTFMFFTIQAFVTVGGKK